MDQLRELPGGPRRWRGVFALVLSLGACASGERPPTQGPVTAADAGEPDPGEPPARPDAGRKSDPEPVGSPPDAAPTTPSFDAGTPAIDARRGEEPAPDAAPPSDANVPPAAPSACPALMAGWTAYQPELSLQFEGGSTVNITSQPPAAMLMDAHCTYTRSGGVELFKMTRNPNGGRQRCEMRVKNEYKTGSQMFEGDVRVTAGNGTTVHQIFKFLMLVAYPQNGGVLHQHSQTFLVSGVFGKWVHVNTVHDTAAGKVDIYIDCVKKLTMNQGGPDTPAGWYHKYGVYNVGGSVAQSEWRDVRYYRK
jgi:hypothetical protein